MFSWARLVWAWRKALMARMTKAQELSRETEEAALRFFRAMLEKLPDARRAQGISYPLYTVVVTALMAAVCGADDAQAMQSWGEANEEWLSEVLDMPHGTPTQDVFLAVFEEADRRSVTRRVPGQPLSPCSALVDR